MINILVANKPDSGKCALASALNLWFDLECYTFNVPSEILYETAQHTQPDVYILNNGL